MKVCRLKIIKANILENNLDSPQITYISQNKNNKKEIYVESEWKIKMVKLIFLLPLMKK